MEINKESAISYIRADINALSEQFVTEEIFAYVNRIRGQLGLLMREMVLTSEEAAELEDEMASARSAAANNVK